MTYICFWVDAIYFNVRLDEDGVCILVIMAADAEGYKELIAVSDGNRESKISWRGLLMDIKLRGLKQGPKLAMGDGVLGFWAAVREDFPEAREQRPWVHKTTNILERERVEF